MSSLGREVVVARSRDGNKELQRILSVRGIEAGAIDAIELDDPASWTAVDSVLTNISQYDWVAFTSPRAAATFGRRMKALGMSTRNPGPRFAAVGPKTATSLREIGIEPEFVPTTFLTSALGEGLPAETGSRVLLLRADIGNKDLVLSLQRRGFKVDDVTAYHTRLVSGQVEPEQVGAAKVIAFASPSEVEGFRRRLDSEVFQNLADRVTVACIGPITARAATRAGFKFVVFAKEHTLEALAEKIEELTMHA